MIAFWAQSLDNESSDLIAVDGSLLPSSEEKMRQKVVSDVHKIVTDKTKIRSNADVSFYRKESKFGIEAIPLERDVANRLSPVVIIGDFPDVENFSTSWIDEVGRQIERFVSENMNRTLPKSTIDTIESWLTEEALYFKKKRSIIQDKVVTLVIATLLPILVGWVIKVRVPQLPPVKVALAISATNLIVLLAVFSLNYKRGGDLSK